MKISAIAKYIDQPGVLAKLHKQMPAILIGGGGLFAAADTFRKPKEERHWLRNTIVAASAIGSLLLAVKYGKLLEVPVHNPKEKIIPLKEIEKLAIEPQEELTSKEVLGEVGRLSLFGLIPVVGGVAGGIAADKITGIGSKKNTANKVKEGIYQFLANVFLCNIGAGAALLGYEGLVKANKIKPSSVKKLGAVLIGIIAPGIIGGNILANFIGKKLINPLFGEQNQQNERRPEALDIAIHADDIAKAGVFAGFRWIEPILPALFFVCGYRAGIGYRSKTHQSEQTLA